MPRNSGGVYSQPAGTAGVPGTTIQSTPYNNLVADVGNELTNSLPTTGVKSMGANLPMGGFRIASMGDPVTSTDAATKNYVDTAGAANVTYFIGGTTTGTAGAQVLASTTPATFTLTAGNKVSFTPGFSNVTTLTLAVGALAATNVYKRSQFGPVPLAGGEVVAAQKTTVTYDGTQYLLDEPGAFVAPQIITPTLTLKNSAAPTPTAEGDLQWDSTNNRVVVGNGSGGSVYISANPATTVDKSVPRYSGTAGAFNTSGVTISDTNVLEAPGGFTKGGNPLLLQKSFESAQQAITFGGSLTLAHGLGAQPKLYLLFLQCTTANAGFSIGDEIEANPGLAYGNLGGQGSDAGISVWPDATNINIRFGSSLTVISKGGGASNISSGSWKLVARAWL